MGMFSNPTSLISYQLSVISYQLSGMRGVGKFQLIPQNLNYLFFHFLLPSNVLVQFSSDGQQWGVILRHRD